MEKPRSRNKEGGGLGGGTRWLDRARDRGVAEERRRIRRRKGWGLRRGEDPPITVALVFPCIRSRRKLASLKRNLNPERRRPARLIFASTLLAKIV